MGGIEAGLFGFLGPDVPWNATCDRCHYTTIIGRGFTSYQSMETAMRAAGWKVSRNNRGVGPTGGRFNPDVNEVDGDLCPRCYSGVRI